jgi:hypothetical protein
MDVLAAYRDVGTYRGAAAVCGTTHKTVKKIIEAHEAARVVNGSGKRMVGFTAAVLRSASEHQLSSSDSAVSSARGSMQPTRYLAPERLLSDSRPLPAARCLSRTASGGDGRQPGKGITQASGPVAST